LGWRTYELNEIFAGLSQSVRENATWSYDQKLHWARIESVFQEIIAAPVLRLSVTANELIFQRPRMLHSARIMTDIRPIFSEDLSSIEATVVSHLLRLAYMTSLGEQEEIEIAPDEGDIEILVSQ